jgi:hypothetical protein
MELIIAVVLFVLIVASWLVLPAAPSRKAAGTSGAPAGPNKAGHTA